MDFCKTKLHKCPFTSGLLSPFHGLPILYSSIPAPPDTIAQSHAYWDESGLGSFP